MTPNLKIDTDDGVERLKPRVSKVIEFSSRQARQPPNDGDDIEALYREHIAHAASDSAKSSYMPSAPLFVAVGIALFGVVVAAIILL
jgi:hypothetical protein